MLACRAPEEVFGAVLRVTAATLAGLGATFWVVDREAQILRPREIWRLATPDLDRYERMTWACVVGPGDGPPARVWRTGLPEWRRALALDARCSLAVAGATRPRWALWIPVRRGVGVDAVVELLSRELCTPDEHLVEAAATTGLRIGAGLDRLETEAALRRSEARRMALQEASVDAIVTIDHRSRITELNPAAERVFGYPRDAAIGRTITGLLIPARLREPHRRAMARYLETGESHLLGRRIEMPALRANGEEFPIELTVTPISSDPPAFTAHIRDISERKRAEEAIRETLESLHTVINASPEDVVQLKDAEGRWLEASPTAVRLFDLGDIEWRGKRDAELADVASFYRDSLRACEASDELTWALGRSTRREEVVPCPDGSSRVFDVVKVPVYQADGRRKLLVILGRDITERRHAEQDRDRLLVEERAARCAAVAAERRTAFLAEASRILSTSLEHQSALFELARLAVPYLADWCMVFVIHADGWIRPAALATSVPDAVRLEAKLERSVVDPAGPGSVAEAIRAAKSVVLRRASPEHDLIAALGLSDEASEMLRPLGAELLVVVPLVARGRTLGALALARKDTGRTCDPNDVALVEDLARRAAQATENARLYCQLEDTVRARDDFLSIASHELRTPIAALQLLTETAKRLLSGAHAHEPGTIARLEKHVDAAHHQVKRLARLIDNLLDVTRISRGRLALELEQVDLGAVVREVAGRFEAMASAAGCSIRLAVAGPCVGVWDRLRVEQVVTNLLSNAIEYAPGAPIEIRVEGDESIGRLVLRDHGPGIANRDVARIFSRFERGSAARRPQGLGLGLFITRQIVEAHSGSIRVTSEPGAGSTFTVELPKNAPEPPAGVTGAAAAARGAY